MCAAALALVLLGAAPSQGPLPTPPERNQQIQSHAANQQSIGQHDKHTADNRTTTLTQTISKDAGRQEQQHRRQGDKESPDWWAVANTAAVTIFTGVLALLAYCQWRAMDRQAKLMHRQAVLMGRQLAEMKTTSVDMHALAITADSQIGLLGRHVDVAGKAADAAKESADTAKLALYALERAEVLVTDVTVVGKAPGQIINLASRIIVMLANTGRSRASGLAYACTLTVSGGDDGQTYSDVIAHGPRLLEPGAWIQEDLPGVMGIAMKAKIDGQTIVDWINSGAKELLFQCDISYNDAFKECHGMRATGKLYRDGVFRVLNTEVP